MFATFLGLRRKIQICTVLLQAFEEAHLCDFWEWEIERYALGLQS